MLVTTSGTLFGANLNRKDVKAFEGDVSFMSIDQTNDLTEVKRITDFIADAKTPELLVTVYDSVQHYGLVKIYDAKLNELKGGKMDKLLFRCHNAGALLTEPKLKAKRVN